MQRSLPLCHHLVHDARAGGPAVSTPTPGMLWSSNEGPVITVKDLVAALERDPVYAKSGLLYQLEESVDFFPG